MELAGRRPLGRRALIEFIAAVALVIAAPVLVTTQASQGPEPWDDIWLGDWPALMESGPDPRTAALHERAVASLARVTNSSSDVHLAGDL